MSVNDEMARQTNESNVNALIEVLRRERDEARDAYGDAMTRLEIEQRDHEETKGYRQHAEHQLAELQVKYDKIRRWYIELRWVCQEKASALQEVSEDLMCASSTEVE